MTWSTLSDITLTNGSATVQVGGGEATGDIRVGDTLLPNLTGNPMLEIIAVNVDSLTLSEAWGDTTAANIAARIQPTGDVVRETLATIDSAVEALLALNFGEGGGTSVLGVVAGTNVNVDNTDPSYPVVSSTADQAGGLVEYIIAGANIGVDNTDPAYPVISVINLDQLKSIVAGANISVDNTDPLNPVISSTDNGTVDTIVAGANVTVDATDPANPVVSAANDGQVDSIVAGSNVTVDNTDPANPVISSTATGDAGGQVDSVVAGSNVTVDNTDPANPVVSADGKVASIVAGQNVQVDNTDPNNPVVTAAGGGGQVDVIIAGSNVNVDNSNPSFPIVSAEGKVATIAAGENITVDNTDPNNPVVSSTASGSIESIVAGDNVTVDNTDPANPIISVEGGSGGGGGSNIIAEHTVSGSAEATILFDGLDNLTEVDIEIVTPATVNVNAIYCYVNGDTTLANYFRNMNYGRDARIYSAEGVDPTVARTDKAWASTAIVKCRVHNGYAQFIATSISSESSAKMYTVTYTMSTDGTVPVAALTSLEFDLQNDDFPVGTRIVLRSPSASASASASSKIQLASFIQGTLTDAELVYSYLAGEAFTLPAGLTDSKGFAATPATAAATLTIKHNDADVGTIDFALGSNDATFTFTTETVINVGDRLALVNQATADATLADLSITLRGTL